jgi:hypothetical protein
MSDARRLSTRSGAGDNFGSHGFGAEFQTQSRARHWRSVIGTTQIRRVERRFRAATRRTGCPSSQPLKLGDKNEVVQRFDRYRTAAGPAFAEGKCATGPKSKWQPKSALETQLQSDGYKVRQIKVEGGCYEVYATDKDGKRANMAYNAETLEKLSNAEAGEN